MFKLAKPGSREQLLVDSGFRAHLTDFNRTTAAAPSTFVSRLRKYLKSRRVTAVSQIGTDRIIEITFSDGQYRLYLEFFAAGNIILTDKDNTVLALLRVVSEGDEDVDIKLGGTYSVRGKQNVEGVPPLTIDRVKDALSKHIARATISAEGEGKKAKKKRGDELRRALQASFPEYPPHLLDHAFKTTSFDASLKPEQVLGDDAMLSQLMDALRNADQIFQDLTSAEHAKGYIIAKMKGKTEPEVNAPSNDSSESDLLYDDFHPFKPSQFADTPGISVLEFDTFNKTVDVFFSSIESQKLEGRLTEREENAKRKLESARQEHQKRVGALQQAQELHIRKAEAIETNAHRVEEAIAAVNGLIGQGMDWQDIAKLIENEQNRQNPVAQMVKLPLKLYENTVTLILNEASFEDEDTAVEGDETDEEVDSDDEEEPKQQGTRREPLTVDVDLALSPWANARQYYEQRRTAQVKEQKTIQSSTRALKSAETKINADLKKGLKDEKQTLRPARRQMWFEKFLYFISSDGYLVVGGRDAQQNETLYRRYLKKGDVYVHADLPGAASVIVKNMINLQDAPIPPSTLSQAGSLSVCSSSAWDSKAVMAAWWVTPDQVSKTAPSGEYLKTGGFMIKGKKNFLPPAQLLLGFAVIFQISDESKANHSKHRFQDPEEKRAMEQQEVTDSVDNLHLQEEDEHSLAGDTAVSEGDGESDESEDEPPEDGNEARSNPLQANGASNDLVESDEDAEGDEVGEEDTVTNNADPDGKAEAKATEATEESTSMNEVTAPASSEKAGKRHLSARERRLLRQGKSLDLPNESTAGGNELSSDADHNEETHDSTADEAPPPSKSTAPATGTSTPLPAARGKRSKNKKAQRKYADQDEEDRELAMQLLGSASGQQQKKQAAAIDKAARDAKSAADKERRRKQHERAAEAERARQERLAAGATGAEVDTAALDEEIDPEILEQERRELSNLDSLVGQPAVGDEILAAIPVCAPWSALAKYKYKVKLQPGSLKKGKAVREMVARWIEAGNVSKGKKSWVDESQTDKEKIWPREMECIRQWRVEEMIGIVPVGKVRVVQGGGAGGGGAGTKQTSGGPKPRGGRGSKKK